VEYPDYLVDDTLNVTLAVGQFGLNVGTVAFFDVARFGSLGIKDLSNPQCLLSTMSNFSLYSNEDVELGAFEAQIHAMLSSKREVGKHR
jgi:hypothetical protein